MEKMSGLLWAIVFFVFLLVVGMVFYLVRGSFALGQASLAGFGAGVNIDSEGDVGIGVTGNF